MKGMLQIDGLTKKFGKRVVLDDITLSLNHLNYGLLGPNGAGKTTLFRVIADLLSADSGSVSADSRKGNPRIGYLPQKFGPFPHLTVEEQLTYFARLKEEKGDQIAWKDEVDRAVRLANLEEQRHLKCRKLSGGMVRRLGIAQAIMGQPDVVLLDEPTVGLDIEERLRLKDILDEIKGQYTLVVSTHIVEDLQNTCQEILVMNRGQIVFQGAADELKAMAEGKIYLVPEEEYKNCDGKMKLISRETRGDWQFARVFMKDKSAVSCRAALLVEPTVEDGYLLLLHGENEQ